MSKWGMVINVSKCTACYSCFIACKDEYWDNDYPPFSAAQPKHGQFWMNLSTVDRGSYPCVKVAHVPMLCQHCENAACISAAKNGAVYKRDDGIVIIDPVKAVGQKQIVDACPYGVIYWNEEKNLPQKCTFCAHRLEEGKEPRCVQICPSEALIFGDLDDPSSKVAKLTAEAQPYAPSLGKNTAVKYIGVPQGMFIAGSAIFGDTDDCADGLEVTLSGNGAKEMKIATNTYGDFMFDGLAKGKYTLKFNSGGCHAKTIDVELTADNYLGDIILER